MALKKVKEFIKKDEQFYVVDLNGRPITYVPSFIFAVKRICDNEIFTCGLYSKDDNPINSSMCILKNKKKGKNFNFS